jgi:uncharacterized glyoxalase superfamily protein PhnB
MQRATPMLSYEDVAGAIAWLGRAFGFAVQGEPFVDRDGRVTQAELCLDGAVVMVGWPGPEYRSPGRHAEECEQAGRWLATPWVIDGVHVSVEDVDGHHERARSNGATILREPESLPFGRLYSAADLEGHRWMFMQAAP